MRGVQKVMMREQRRRARSEASLLLPVPSQKIDFIFLKRREFVGVLFETGDLNCQSGFCLSFHPS